MRLLTDEALDTALPYRRTVEDVLQVPLLPSEIPDYAVQEYGGVPDIRMSAHDIVARAVESVVRAERGIRHDMATLFISLAGDQPLSERERRLLVARHGSDITQIRRQVVVANNVANSYAAPYLEPAGADPATTPRAQIQSKINAGINRFVQHPHPSTIKLDNPGPLDVIRSGMLFVSATASGKTVPIAQLLRRAGVGKPYCDAAPEPIRALVALPAHLIPQYLGRTGNQTFLRWLGNDVDIQAIYAGSKNNKGEVQLSSTRLLPAAIDSGLIDLADFPLRIIDEGHRLLEPRMLRRLGSLGSRLFLFTATPAYKHNKDLRNYFPDYTASTLRSSAESGATSPVRLITFEYGPEAGSAERLAASVAAHFIQKGKQVLTFCKPGGNAAQAHSVEQLTNSTVGGEEPVAKAIGSFRTRQANEAIQLDYEKGKLRNIIATRMLREGWDGPVDVLILTGLSTSPLDQEQKIGRAARPGDEDKLIIELLPRGRRALVSAWSIYGLEDGLIQQGMRIGPPLEGALAGAPPDGLAMEQPSRQQVRQGGNTVQEATAPAIDDLGLPEELRQHLMVQRPVRSILIAPEGRRWHETPPPGSVSAAEYAQLHNVPLTWLHNRLDKASIPYTGVWRTPAEDDLGGYERWYDGDLFRQYLEAHTLPSLITATQMSRKDIAVMCGVSVSTISRICDELNPSYAAALTGRNNKDTRVYDFDAVRRIVAKVDEIPVAEESDVPVPDLHQELGWFVYSYIRSHPDSIMPAEKRRHPGYGVPGYCHHVSAEQAAILRNPPDVGVATNAHIGMSEIARCAEANLHAVIRVAGRLNEKQPGLIVPLRPGEGRRARDYLPRPWGELLIETMKRRKLTPDVVPRSFLTKYFAKGKSTIIYWIDRLSEETGRETEYLRGAPINIGGRGGEEMCYPWATLELLEDSGMPRREGVEPIDRQHLARTPDDPDWSYSQKVQRRFLRADQLANQAEYLAAKLANKASQPAAAPAEPAAAAPELVSWHDYEAVRAVTGCSAYAFTILLARGGIDESELERGPEQQITRLADTVLAKLEPVLRNIGPAITAGWNTLKNVAWRASPTTPIDAVMACVEQMEQQRGHKLTDRELRLGRGGLQVDVYVSDATRNEIVRILKASR